LHQAKILSKLNADIEKERIVARQRAREAGINQEIWEREDGLRVLTKTLRVGMGASEVEKILGKPTRGGNPESVPSVLEDPVAEQFVFHFPVTTKHSWVYSSHPERTSYLFHAHDQFQLLMLGFGNDNRLKTWFWLTPATN
jgi:hypothetical protein